MSGRDRALLLGAALEARRGSIFPGEVAAEVAAASQDEEAGLGGEGGGVTTAEGAPSTANHDVSAMPTVVENRRGEVAPAAEPPATFGAAETKMDGEEGAGEALPVDTAVPEVGSLSSSSIRQRRPGLAQGDEPPPPSSPFAASSSGGGGSGGSASGRAPKTGSARGSLADSSGHGAGNSILAMFKKASHTFSHHNALSRGTGGGGGGGSGGEHPDSSSGQGRQHHGPVIPARGKLTEEDEAMLSDSEADYDAFDDNTERIQKKLLSPNFRFFRWYTTYMLLVLLCFVFYMPIRIAFYPREGGGWSAVDLVWNILFAIDIVIRLNMGFVDANGTVVYDRAAIFWRYAKRWLIVDFLAAFPFTFIPGLGPDDEGFHEVAYLLSLPKMFRVYSLMAMAQENHRLHEGAFMAIRTVLAVLVTAHLFGCGWYMLATLLYTECEDLYFDGLPEGEFIFANGLAYTAPDYIASECPWIYRNDYAALPVGRRFLGSVYWALTTLTTVGYGDLSARTTAEQIYSMAVQIVGVSWYAYIVGTWASVLNSFDQEDKEQRSKMREVVAFSKAAGLPPDIAKKVRQHFRFALYRQDNWITFNEQELVADMPSGLRADVITHVHMSTISQIPWLEGKEKAFVADVAIMLKPRLFMNGDLLYRRASQPEEMFFIAGGFVMLKYKHNRVGGLRQGQMAGLIGLVSCEKHKVTAVAQRDTQCYGLSRANFMELMENYPKEMQEIVDAAKSLAQSIALSSAEAKRDLMSNDILSALISKPQALMGVETVGGERWTELQNDSMGHGSESSSRPSLPVTFSRGAPQVSQQQQQQQQQQQSPFTSSAPRTSGSETDALSSSAASNLNSNPSSFSSAAAPMPTSLSTGSMPRFAGGSGEVGTGAGGAGQAAEVEKAVALEVSRRLSAVEDRLGAVMERLEGFLDAADASSPEK